MNAEQAQALAWQSSMMLGQSVSAEEAAQRYETLKSRNEPEALAAATEVDRATSAVQEAQFDLIQTAAFERDAEAEVAHAVESARREAAARAAAERAARAAAAAEAAASVSAAKAPEPSAAGAPAPSTAQPLIPSSGQRGNPTAAESATLARIRKCESRGNYSIVSASGRYRGAYQFDFTTWRGVGGSGDPAAASPDEQDYPRFCCYAFVAHARGRSAAADRSRAVPAAYRPIAVFSRHRIATARVDSRHECARQRNAVNARLRLPVLIGVVALVAMACAAETHQPAFTGDISKGNPAAEEADAPKVSGDAPEPVDLTAAETAQLQAALASSPTGCDFLDTRDCLLPFPSDTYTVDDPATGTGRRVALPQGMLANVDGQTVDPTAWNRNDGFSPNTPILAYVPGIDPDATALPSEGDIGFSLTDESATVIVDLDSGQLVPHWAEMDLQRSERRRPRPHPPPGDLAARDPPVRGGAAQHQEQRR
ncbi:MAG: transglycosylase family protein [Microthrixaceae bacterium]